MLNIQINTENLWIQQHQVVLLCKRLERHARCLKITEKVSFNIASEASYVYILSRRKFIKNAKNGPFLSSF